MRLWIDTDVGTNPDDAVALLCALAHPEVDLVGVSTVGADATAGMLAMRIAEESKQNAAVIFRDISATFLERATSNVTFTCEAGEQIRQLIAESKASGKRQSSEVAVTAQGVTRRRTVRSSHSWLSASEPVAHFGLGAEAFAERVEVEPVEVGRVGLHHGSHLLLGHAAEGGPPRLGGERVAALRVWVVGAPHDPVDADVVAQG